MTEREPDSAQSSAGVIDGIVEIDSSDAVVSKTVSKIEDQVQVEIATEATDGTYEVSAYRFFITCSGSTAVPKHEVDSEYRLHVVSALRKAGYDPQL